MDALIAKGEKLKNKPIVKEVKEEPIVKKLKKEKLVDVINAPVNDRDHQVPFAKRAIINVCDYAKKKFVKYRVNCYKDNNKCTHTNWRYLYYGNKMTKDREVYYAKNRKKYDITPELINGEVYKHNKKTDPDSFDQSYRPYSLKWGKTNCRISNSIHDGRIVVNGMYNSCRLFYCKMTFNKILSTYWNVLPEECYKSGCNSKGMCDSYVKLFYAQYGRNGNILESLSSSVFGSDNSIANLLARNPNINNKVRRALAKNKWGDSYTMYSMVRDSKRDPELIELLFKDHYTVRRYFSTDIKSWKNYIDRLVKDKESGVRFLLMCNPRITSHKNILKILAKDECKITRNHAKALLEMKGLWYMHNMCGLPNDVKTEFHDGIEEAWEGYPCKAPPTYMLKKK